MTTGEKHLALADGAKAMYERIEKVGMDGIGRCRTFEYWGEKNPVCIMGHVIDRAGLDRSQIKHVSINDLILNELGIETKGVENTSVLTALRDLTYVNDLTGYPYEGRKTAVLKELKSFEAVFRTRAEHLMKAETKVKNEDTSEEVPK